MNIAITLNVLTVAQIFVLTMMYPLVLTTTHVVVRVVWGRRRRAVGHVYSVLRWRQQSNSSKIGNYWVYAIVVYWSLGCVLLVRTYLNYRSDEDNTLRNASIAAGLIFFAFMGAGTFAMAVPLFPNFLSLRRREFLGNTMANPLLHVHFGRT